MFNLDDFVATLTAVFPPVGDFDIITMDGDNYRVPKPTLRPDLEEKLAFIASRFGWSIPAIDTGRPIVRMVDRWEMWEMAGRESIGGFYHNKSRNLILNKYEQEALGQLNLDGIFLHELTHWFQHARVGFKGAALAHTVDDVYKIEFEAFSVQDAFLKQHGSSLVLDGRPVETSEDIWNFIRAPHSPYAIRAPGIVRYYRNHPED